MEPTGIEGTCLLLIGFPDDKPAGTGASIHVPWGHGLSTSSKEKQTMSETQLPIVSCARACCAVTRYLVVFYLFADLPHRRHWSLFIILSSGDRRRYHGDSEKRSKGHRDAKGRPLTAALSRFLRSGKSTDTQTLLCISLPFSLLACVLTANKGGYLPVASADPGSTLQWQICQWRPMYLKSFQRRGEGTPCSSLCSQRACFFTASLPLAAVFAPAQQLAAKSLPPRLRFTSISRVAATRISSSAAFFLDK